MTAKRLPASIRNKNPGAQQPGPVSKKFGSVAFQTLNWKGPDGRPRTNTIATFPTDIQGGAALFYLLASPSYADGKRTIRQAISKWCGGYYVSTYLKVLYARSGLDGDTVLTRGLVCNPDVAIPLAKAMAWQEAGMEYPMTDEEWLKAHAMALPDAHMQAVPVAAVAKSPDAPAREVEGWDRSIRSSPEMRIAETAASSRTVRWSFNGMLTWIGAKFEEGYGLLSSAFDTAQSAVGPNTPLGLIAGAAKISTTQLFVFIGLAVLLIIIARRFADAEEGKR